MDDPVVTVDGQVFGVEDEELDLARGVGDCKGLQAHAVAHIRRREPCAYRLVLARARLEGEHAVSTVARKEDGVATVKGANVQDQTRTSRRSLGRQMIAECHWHFTKVVVHTLRLLAAPRLKALAPLRGIAVGR